MLERFASFSCYCTPSGKRAVKANSDKEGGVYVRGGCNATGSNSVEIRQDATCMIFITKKRNDFRVSLMFGVSSRPFVKNKEYDKKKLNEILELH